MKKALKFLKKNIQASMTLSEMLDVFEEMSKLPIKTDDDTLLLDTCYHDPTFSGNVVHIFSLVRQVPDSKGEYYQLRLEITLETQETEISFPTPIWSDAIEGQDFFEVVRNSTPYQQAIKQKMIKAEVHLDRT
jgi:hypothetical protein